jgi:hypothetical protein
MMFLSQTCHLMRDEGYSENGEPSRKWENIPEVSSWSKSQDSSGQEA